jgi:hypothetical protein
MNALHDEREQVFDQVCALPKVTTTEGAQAMARASLAVAPRNEDGELIWPGESERLAWSIAEYLA